MLESHFDKADDLIRPTTLLKRDSKTGVFPVKYAKFLRTPLVAAFVNNEKAGSKFFLYYLFQCLKNVMGMLMRHKYKAS